MIKWNLVKYFKKAFIVGNGKETTKKAKIFTWSIVSGVLLAMIILAILQPGTDPFSVLFKGIKSTFKTPLGVSKFVTVFTILGLAGIAVGVGFKTGLFNIGVSGQMIVGGMTAGIMALKIGDSMPNGVGQIFIIFICILFGAITAGIAGLLKAYFRIHEVVSTILINWIAFFYMKWIMDPNTSTYLDAQGLHSVLISSHYLLRINGNPLWPSLIILISSGAIIWFIIYKTNLGLKLKMTGLNPEATRFSGVNIKLTAFYSMAISGGISGLLGAVLYFGVQSQFSVPKADVIPLEGYNGIAIALIGFSNPILIIPVSIFFGLIQMGIIYSNGSIDVTFVSTILGILMYISAIGSMFYYLKINKWIYILFNGKVKYANYEKYRLDVEKIDTDAYETYAQSKTKQLRIKVMQKHIADSNKLRVAYKGGK